MSVLITTHPQCWCIHIQGTICHRSASGLQLELPATRIQRLLRSGSLHGLMRLLLRSAASLQGTGVSRLLWPTVQVVKHPTYRTLRLPFPKQGIRHVIAMATAQEVRATLVGLLQTIDPNTATERKIREQVAEKLGDISEHKKLIKVRTSSLTCIGTEARHMSTGWESTPSQPQRLCRTLRPSGGGCAVSCCLCCCVCRTHELLIYLNQMNDGMWTEVDQSQMSTLTC